ncbi:olfactory receptor 5P4-like [Microcebus murinus]|uniref:olfactory receptor 5P4-like n=1 Tax=Microcebus murinus TaxID=30608 RepID=UPI003F6C70E4
METGNGTMVTEFIILGLTEDPILCAVFFVVFLGIYIVTISGNISIIMLIRRSPQLHTPMYLFLSHLAFVDIGYSTSVTPVMIVSFVRERIAIPVAGCIAQLGSDVVFGTAEAFLLAAMAYDRYAAICSPLLYSTRMSPRVCIILLVAAYVGGCVNSSSCTGCLLSLTFCGPNKINHFFCDLPPLVKLSCTHIYIAELSPIISAGSVIVTTLFIIIVSYVYILHSILKMRSTEGRHKAFSTCTSHLTVVTLFYGTVTFVYVIPKSSHSDDHMKVVSVFYTVIIPMLNPLIYSLRNKEVKEAMRKLIVRIHSSFERNTIRVAGLGHHINECNGPIEQSDHSEVGGAGGEGLVAPLGGAHLQDGDEDVDVEDGYDKHSDHNDGASRKRENSCGDTGKTGGSN